MFKKSERYSFKKGLPSQVLSDPLFTLRYQPNESFSTKCAVVVSKKVSMKAVLRNKIKRLILEAIKAELGVRKLSYDLVFFAKKNIVGYKYEDIRMRVHDVFKKTNLL